MLSGSESSDADGDALTYKWNWQVAGEIYDSNSIECTMELPVGVHTIKLVVNDGLTDSKPDDVNITVIAPVDGKLKITPQIVNRKGNQPFINATVELEIIAHRILI